MRTILLLIACTAISSCYAATGPQDGTREVSAADQGADAGGVSPSADGGGADTQPTESTPTPEDPVKLLVLEQVQGKTVCYDTEGVYGEQCGTAKIYLRDLKDCPKGETCETIAMEECAPNDVGIVSFQIPEYGTFACIESEWVSLSLCKNNASICNGHQYLGGAFILGTCAFPEGQTTLTPCTQHETCGNEGYCKTDADQEKKAVLPNYWDGNLVGVAEYFFPTK